MVCDQVSRGIPEVLEDSPHLVHSWRLVAFGSNTRPASLVCSEFFFLEKTSIEKKKRFLSGIGPLFSEVKIQDLKVSLELKILYIL